MTHIIAVAMLSLAWGYNAPQDPVDDLQDPQETAVSATIMPGDEGLDLTALVALARECSNAQDLEFKLNQPGSINNVDLDHTGTIDYIYVSEYLNDDVRGFSLYVDKEGMTKQEIATIEFTEQPDNTANVVVVGNEYLYGEDAHYESSVVLADLLLWSYLMSEHPYYHSPWHYGYYPRYYHVRPTHDFNTYQRRVYNDRRTVVVNRTPAPDHPSRSPNAIYSTSRYTRDIRPVTYNVAPSAEPNRPPVYIKTPPVAPHRVSDNLNPVRPPMHVSGPTPGRLRDELNPPRTTPGFKTPERSGPYAPPVIRTPGYKTPEKSGPYTPPVTRTPGYKTPEKSGPYTPPMTRMPGYKTPEKSGPYTPPVTRTPGYKTPEKSGPYTPPMTRMPGYKTPEKSGPYTPPVTRTPGYKTPEKSGPYTSPVTRTPGYKTPDKPAPYTPPVNRTPAVRTPSAPAPYTPPVNRTPAVRTPSAPTPSVPTPPRTMSSPAPSKPSAPPPKPSTNDNKKKGK